MRGIESGPNQLLGALIFALGAAGSMDAINRHEMMLVKMEEGLGNKVRACCTCLDGHSRAMLSAAPGGR